jgi:GNAT superfamily N-acetyltransferase
VVQLPNIQIEVESDPDGAIAATIEDRLIEALRQNVPPSDSEPLVLLARQGTAIVGGLVGTTSYGWLLVKMLWAAKEMRRRGLGACLMAKAEALARSRGCHGAWLDTSSVVMPNGSMRGSDTYRLGPCKTSEMNVHPDTAAPFWPNGSPERQARLMSEPSPDSAQPGQQKDGIEQGVG